MRIEIASLSGQNNITRVNVEHLGEKITFTVPCYKKGKFEAGFDVFSQINAYWSDLPEKQQQAIFDIYRQVFIALLETYSSEALETRLKVLSTELLSYHKLDLIEDWIAVRAHDIKVPANILNEFVSDPDRNLSVGRTYLVPDYRKLTALALCLRCMIPIWGEYISNIRDSKIDESRREMRAFQLVDKVFTNELPVIWKLNDYIENTIASMDLSRSFGIFLGISTTDYPRWLLSLIMIYCLPVGDIRGVHPDAHLITFIHMVLNNKINPKEDSGDTRIKRKEISEDGQDDSRGGSTALERYKVKAAISTGDIVEYEYSLSNFTRCAKALAPGISEHDIRQAVARMGDYEGLITRPQRILLGWIFKPVASPNIYDYFNEQLLKHLLGVCEEILWHRGHHYLAVLMSCHPVTSESEMVVSSVDSKQRIPEPLVQKLDELYPFRISQKTKRSQTRDVNPGVESIDSLADRFTMFGWRPVSEPARVEKALGYMSTHYRIKPDIKSDLARLLIQQQTRSYLQT